MSSSDFLYYFFIIVQNTREVHHFTEVFYFFAQQKIFYVSGIKFISGCFKNGGRHAAWGAKIEFKRNSFSIFDHELNTFYAADISNFVWIANRCHSAMHNRQLRKFRGHKHGAFNMNMRINKAGKNVTVNGEW